MKSLVPIFIDFMGFVIGAQIRPLGIAFEKNEIILRNYIIKFSQGTWTGLFNQDVVVGSINDGRSLNCYEYINGNPI